MERHTTFGASNPLRTRPRMRNRAPCLRRPTTAFSSPWAMASCASSQHPLRTAVLTDTEPRIGMVWQAPVHDSDVHGSVAAPGHCVGAVREPPDGAALITDMRDGARPLGGSRTAPTKNGNPSANRYKATCNVIGPTAPSPTCPLSRPLPRQSGREELV